MKNFLKIFVVALMFSLTACQEDRPQGNASVMQSISNNQIYFFYQNTCPHCHHAAQYIKSRHPELKMINVDVRNPNGYNLFLKCAQKFSLNQASLGTPLICMGTHYIMGWSDEDAARFDSYASRFK